MNLRTPFITMIKTPKLMHPLYRTFAPPPLNTKTTAMLGLTPRDHRTDASRPQLLPMRIRVIRPITEQFPRPAARTTRLATHRRNRVNHLDQLRDIVAVGLSHLLRQRHTRRVRKNVMFAASFPPI